MSLISGFIVFNSSTCPEKANNLLLNSFPHPEHFKAKIWIIPGIGLGHRKLPTFQQPITSTQPLSLAPQDLIITADVRLDNRPELLEKLSLQQIEQKDISDSFLILKAFLQWGEKCVEHLLGDFAFAIWDNRTRQLFAARDHLGIRPFYYHSSSQCFAFCNEMQGLLSLPDITKSLDDLAVADFLVGYYENCQDTIYQAIKRLPPAHSLSLQGTRLQVTRYWQLEKQEPLRLAKDSDYADALREQILQATACRLRTAFPAGVMLSGGLDSSALTAIADEICQQRNIAFTTYSYALPQEDSGDGRDERRYIDILLQRTGVDHTYVEALQQTPFMFSDKYFAILAEPLRDPFYFIQEAIYKAARHNKVRVLLTGIGGDMTASFRGSNCLAHLTTQLKLRRLYELLSLQHTVSGVSIPLIIRRQIVAKILPPTIFSAYKFLFNNKNFAPQKEYAVSRPLAKKIGLHNRLKNLRKLEAKQNSLDHQQQILSAVTSGHLAAFMEHRHTSAAAFGISVSHPYFDRRIVEFCMSMPHEQFVRDGWLRSIFRRAVKDLLPPEITYRADKQPFIPDYAQRIVQNAALINSILHKNNVLTKKYLDIEKVTRHLHYLCATSDNIDWHPGTISLLGHGVSLAAFLHWSSGQNSEQNY